MMIRGAWKMAWAVFAPGAATTSPAQVLATLADFNTVSSTEPSVIPHAVVQLAQLTASDGLPNDLLGASVAMSGKTIVVGAFQHPMNNNQPGPGAAYVYVKPATGWKDMTEVAELTASDGQPLDQFGYSVAKRTTQLWWARTWRQLEAAQHRVRRTFLSSLRVDGRT